MTPEERTGLATELSNALSRELTKPEPLPPLSLYRIEVELQELLEAQEDAEAAGDADALAVIAERVKQYVLAEVKKVDRIAEATRACAVFAEECEKEAARLTAMAKRHRNRMERIKGAALWAMQALGVRRLDTPTNRLRVQANGGVEPLEVTAKVEELDPALRTITVTMSQAVWNRVFSGRGIPGTDRDLMKVTMSPDNDAIRAELKKRVPCPECDGEGKTVCSHRNATEQDKECPDCDENGMESCPRCEGSGTVPTTVPGARLLPRGVHLRVE